MHDLHARTLIGTNLNNKKKLCENIITKKKKIRKIEGRGKN